MEMWLRSDPVLQVPCPNCIDKKEKYASYYGLVCFLTVILDDSSDLAIFESGKCDKCGAEYEFKMEQIKE